MWVQDTQQNKKYTTRHMNKIWRNAFSLRVKPSSFFPSFPFRNWYTQPNQILSLPFCACTPVRGTWVSTCMLKRPETSITLNFSACVACQSPGLCMQHIYSFPLSSFFIHIGDLVIYFWVFSDLLKWLCYLHFLWHHAMELRDGRVVKGHTVILWTD